MYRGFYFIQYIISRFDNKHFRGQHSVESNYMQAENAVQYYLILDEKMHAFVPKHCQNLLYKPNKPDREEQISVAMFSHKTYMSRQQVGSTLDANRKAANTLGMR